jgi:hypothetical protein
MLPPFPKFILDIIVRSYDPNREIGGYITTTAGGHPLLWQIPNIAIDRATTYQPDPIDQHKVFQQDTCPTLFHSHILEPDSQPRAGFTGKDINQIWASNIPWLLLSKGSPSNSPVTNPKPEIPNPQWNYFNPRTFYAYLGRTWNQSLHDCYTIVRDVYRFELAIDLPIPHHSGNDTPWRVLGWNDPLNTLPAHFDRVPNLEDAQPYDLIMWHPKKGTHQTPSHFGILIPIDGALKVLHHLYLQTSSIDTIGDPSEIHSIWRSKCSISPSKFKANWASVLERPTNLVLTSSVRELVT